jgi:ribonuclease HI
VREIHQQDISNYLVSMPQRSAPLAAMEAPVFDRGETAEVTLWLDGSAPRPSGPGGYGGVATINGHCFVIVGRLGHTTKDVAEFVGLIGCMRGILRTLQMQGWRHEYSSLVVLSDSDAVIDCMQGASKVKSSKILLLCDIIISLQREFRFVSYTKIGPHENIQAHSLAVQGREAFSRPSLAVYHPSPCGFIDVWVEGVRTLASHDMNTSGKDPSFMIDSRFLRSIPNGKSFLRNLKDPYPLSLVRSKVNMTVLGKIQLYCGVRCFGTPLRLTPPCGADTEGCATFIVVQDLPVPVHISWKNENFPMNTEATTSIQNLVPFHPTELPDVFHFHRYWTEDTKFNGMEM